ncbi:MAG: hypothetical protein AUH25_02050 [Thaumarchaeota archaeon 13_1_40CM_38_12]|nr:MAG: hypothetical protein AUH25_02050 [Thaumarchaeota archaeon 13_1_40CM_38_12]OLD41004.1 MAG: hypothetical protein AUI60_03045 [Thaumarchaeota archaeon 13_1_40CM_2_39_4]
MTTKRSEQNQDESLKPSKELQLGSRKVSKQNKSNIVTLPRVFIENSCKSENMEVNMTLLTDGSLKLSPICKTKEHNEKVKKDE